MSEFSGNGFKPFPNTMADLKQVSNVEAWSREHLEHKTNEYGAFLTREDIIPRAIAAGNLILDRLLFEMAYRDGVYDEFLIKGESNE